MEIWLKKGKASRSIRLPVLPAEYKVAGSQKNTEVNVIGLGDVTLRGKPGLREISFSSFFPREYNSSYCDFSNIRDPMDYVEIIEKMKRSGTVKLIITGTPVNFVCTIERFEWGEDDGTGDVSYTITLKEYRSVDAWSTGLVSVAPVT